MSARIKARIISKEVRNHTCGIPTRTVKTMSVTATGLDMHQRLVLLNLGELQDLLSAARLMVHARQEVRGASDWERNRGTSLVALLEDAVKLQPGLEVEVPQ